MTLFHTKKNTKSLHTYLPTDIIYLTHTHTQTQEQLIIILFNNAYNFRVICRILLNLKPKKKKTKSFNVSTMIIIYRS